MRKPHRKHIPATPKTDSPRQGKGEDGVRRQDWRERLWWVLICGPPQLGRI